MFLDSVPLKMCENADKALLTLYDLRTNDVLYTHIINTCRWKKESTFFCSYLSRWSDGTSLNYGISVGDFDAFHNILSYIEFGHFNKTRYSSMELINIMNLSFFLGISSSLNDAFQIFSDLPSLSKPIFDEIINVSNAPYFEMLENTSLFFQRYVRERYRYMLFDIIPDHLAVFPLSFMESLLTWNDLPVSSENDVIILVDNWINIASPSVEDIDKIVSLIRMTRLSLPFINQVVMNVSWLKMSHEILHILQNFKANEDNLRMHEDIYFSDLLPSTWLLDYRNNVYFKGSLGTKDMSIMNDGLYSSIFPTLSVRLSTETFREWLENSNSMDPLVAVLQNYNPMMGFYWKISISIYKDHTRRIEVSVSCRFITDNVYLDIFHMLSINIDIGIAMFGDIITHTGKTKMLYSPSVLTEDVPDWNYFNNMFKLNANNGLLMICRIQALDT